MKKDQIKSIYLKKIKQLIKYNKFYFDKSKPIISDRDYDDLKKEIIKLEEEHNFLKSKDSPSFSIGHRPSKNFVKSKHRVRMLSLSNAFDKKDLENFEKKIFNFLNFEKNKDLEYSVEPKIDGISASLTYKNGKLISGLSRGNGAEGELITENLRTIFDIPKEVNSSNFPKDIDIRGEVFITNRDFEKIKDKFANPRNAASGTLRQKDSAETKKIPLNFIAYTYGYSDNLGLKKQSDFLKYLETWGFKTSKFNKVISGLKNLLKHHEEFEKKRFDLDYDIDGLVYKLNNFDLQKRLGFVANAPRWAIAHKFSADSSFSEIIDIDIQVGRTGALTPVAKIKPVNIGGVVVSNATLHNEDEINRKDIRIGDTAEIERAGDVIPHVLSVDINKRKKNSKKYIFPDKCPSCGSVAIKEFNKLTKKYDAVRRCPSEGFQCEKIAIERIKHFVSKEALNIDGLGRKVVEKFWELKIIRFPQDIFKIDFNRIQNLDGWGKLSASNLKYAIETSKKISLDKFIYSLGIRHIGQENAKLMASYFGSVQKFKNLLDFKKKDENLKNLNSIDGIGEIQIKSIDLFCSNKKNAEVTNELIKKLKIDDHKIISSNSKLSGKTFMFTGALNSMSRAEAKNLVENLGGKIVSTVSKKLNYLIIGNKPTNRKLNEAKNLNVKVITEKKWNELINI